NLVPKIRARKEIAHVGVLRHHPQRLLFTGPADHYLRVWLLKRLRARNRLAQFVKLALKRLLLAAPHLFCDLQRLLESLKARTAQGRRQPERLRLLVVPAGADAPDSTPA